MDTQTVHRFFYSLFSLRVMIAAAPAESASVLRQMQNEKKKLTNNNICQRINLFLVKLFSVCLNFTFFVFCPFYNKYLQDSGEGDGYEHAEDSTEVAEYCNCKEYHKWV